MKGYLCVFLVVALTTTGQLLTKKGAHCLRLHHTRAGKIKGLFNKYIFLAALFTLAAPFFYILALQEIPLAVAFAFTGLNYALVSFGGKLFFGEKLNKYHYLGISCVFLGIAVYHF